MGHCPALSARYVAKMEDVLEVYARPCDVRPPVVCLDEKSKELHGTPHGEQPLQPGRERRQDYEYTRNGTANLFLALEPSRGWRPVHVTERRTASDFAERLRLLVDEEYPDAETIVLVTDNLNTHSTACLYERFSPAQARRIASKLEWHYIPEHGSWLNMAECELSVLARQCLNRRIPDAQTLITETDAWQTHRNAATVTVNWHFTNDEARTKLKRLYPSFKVSTLT